jgi:hypothetical protein
MSTMPTMLKQVVGLEDVKHALSETLGPDYKVNTKSDFALTVHRSGLMGVRVTLSWSEGTTTFRVRPGGAILVLLFNTLYTAPKVRRALVRAFGS